jgi:hypothetical protein
MLQGKVFFDTQKKQPIGRNSQKSKQRKIDQRLQKVIPFSSIYKNKGDD